MICTQPGPIPGDRPFTPRNPHSTMGSTSLAGQILPASHRLPLPSTQLELGSVQGDEEQWAARAGSSRERWTGTSGSATEPLERPWAHPFISPCLGFPSVPLLLGAVTVSCGAARPAPSTRGADPHRPMQGQPHTWKAPLRRDAAWGWGSSSGPSLGRRRLFSGGSLGPFLVRRSRAEAWLQGQAVQIFLGRKPAPQPAAPTLMHHISPLLSQARNIC